MIELPANIRDSVIFTDTDKSALAQVKSIPLVDPSFYDVNLTSIVQYFALSPDEMELEVQKYAAKLLAKGKVNEAWQVLLVTN
ncbi:MAG: hypothetical protein M3040_03115 [Bacteroidota bacterium]|nr:hypothetical protein [Bacteroidota bacterium]